MGKIPWTILLPVIFLAYSLPIFLRVYTTTLSVIDEEFHLRQGLAYCNKRFEVWDPKITTFPGLYLVSLVLSPLNMCSVFGLRLISLLAAASNVSLLYKIRLRNIGNDHRFSALEAFTMAALPPLYFFAHLYYTDTLSLTAILLLYLNWQKQAHLPAAVCAAASVLIRQTNVIWVAMFFGITALDELCNQYAQSKRINKEVSLLNLKTLLDIFTSVDVIMKSVWMILGKCSFYLVVILPFIAFIFLNGSIVVGDKQAHEATLHITQIFYFSLFTLFFGVSSSFHQLSSTIQQLRAKKILVICGLVFCVMVVKWNTLVHPYLLADNRHYIFYIWNRLYGRYYWFKYAITPVYVLAIMSLYNRLCNLSDNFKIMLGMGIILSLCFQRLLELRYFLVPFILVRLNTPPIFIRKSQLLQWLELAFYIILNSVTFYIFFSKELVWTEFKEPQRIIW